MSSSFNPDQLLGDSELGELFGVPAESIQTLAAEGILEVFEGPDGVIRYPLKSSVQSFVEFCRSERRELV
jgi:hypothetical protein